MTLSYMKAMVIAGVLGLGFQSISPAMAQDYNYHGYASHVRCSYDHFAHEHPKIKTTAVDAAIGTGAGALVGAISGRGALHGALIGAGAGAGIGLVRSSETMVYHPVAKTASEIGIGALGVYLAARHGHNY